MYTPEQLDTSLQHVFGADTQIIRDGTYYVVEEEGVLVACGGWSRRRTLYGGDQLKGGEISRLRTVPRAAVASFTVPVRGQGGKGRCRVDLTERKRLDEERERLLASKRAALAEAVAAQQRFRDLVNSVEGMAKGRISAVRSPPFSSLIRPQLPERGRGALHPAAQGSVGGLLGHGQAGLS
jgi:hypothetical protein